MSCKVRGGDEALTGEPIEWRLAKEAGARGAQGAADALAAQAERLQAEFERRVAQARDEALREGEEGGRRRAYAEVEPALRRLALSLEEIGALKARLRKEAEADLVKLALAIARRVLQRELSVDPEALRGLAMGAMSKLQAGEVQRVTTHPSHAAALASWLGAGSGRTIEVIPDPSREPGDVFFETSRGDLDASIGTQLNEIERGLADTLRRRT
jgi:flagellar assembly protein FliH